jgi:pimeloyl-ACP methyl ester carboxylesterase
MRRFSALLLFPLLALPLLAPAATVAATSGAEAAAPSATALAAPTTDKTFTVGTLRVQQYGHHGRPLILIPGLEGGSWVWRDAIQHFRNDHVIYAVTLAGFDGLPPPKGNGNYFDMADTSLLKLIKTHHIKKPVLVGHSLGGTLSIRFAEEHSNLLSGVVALDGLPVFPTLARASATQRKAAAAQMAQEMVGGTPAQFRAGVDSFMLKYGMIDPKQAKRYAALNARSNQAATAKYAAEDLGADYRPGLKQIKVPLLEISPYYKPDFSKPPMKFTAMQKATFYRQLLSGAPRATVVSISPSRHFAMLDQPGQFRAILASFLVALPKQ